MKLQTFFENYGISEIFKKYICNGKNKKKQEIKRERNIKRKFEIEHKQKWAAVSWSPCA